MALSTFTIVARPSPQLSPERSSPRSTETPCPWDNSAHLSPRLLWPHPTFCLGESDSPGDLIWMEAERICPFVTGYFYLAYYPQGSSMLWRVSESPSFLRLKIIFHCMYELHSASPFIHQWTLELLPLFWLPWMVCCEREWTNTYLNLCSQLSNISITWRRKWQPTPVFLPWEFYGQRSLEVYSPWGCKESDTTDTWVWSSWTTGSFCLTFWRSTRLSSIQMSFYFPSFSLINSEHGEDRSGHLEKQSSCKCYREEANSDSMLELFPWLAFHCFCCYNHTEWPASENSAPLPDC